MENFYYKDKQRYINGKMPLFQKYFRKYQSTSNFILKFFYKILFILTRNKKHIELSEVTKIGGVVYWTPLLYNN